MLNQIKIALEANDVTEAVNLQRQIEPMNPDRGVAFQTIRHFQQTGEISSELSSVEGKIGSIQDVIEYVEDLSGKSRKAIKTTGADILLAGHVIQQNSGMLQATMVMKVAKALMEDRIENEVEGFKLETVVKKKGVTHTLQGDVHEALIIIEGYKIANLAFIDEAGKLIACEFKEVINKPCKKPLTTPSEIFEIRRGVADQGVPKAIDTLQHIPYTIDQNILKEATLYGDHTKYSEKLALEVGAEMEGEFYFPYFGDSRVRSYTDISCGFSSQGNDLGKAVIKNKNLVANKDLTPEFIRMANDYMDGACPFEITPENLLLIPYKEAPKYKYRMLQLQNDYKEYLWTGTTSANSDLDARCSGNQILSLIGGNSDVTAHLGMEEVEHERDLYEQNAYVFNKILEKEAPQLLETYPVIVTRKPCKRPTMTDVYNATLTSIMENFSEFGVDQKDVADVAKLMKKALKKSGGKNAEIMEWLKGSARIISKAGNKTIEWTRPDGIIASQTYIKYKELLITKKIQMTDSEIKQAQIQGRSRPKDGWRHNLRAQIQVPHLDINGQESSDSMKHVNAISADVIHSLDSTLAFKIIEILREQGIDATRFVHDSISVHMNFKQELYNASVEASIWLFDCKFLESLKAEWEEKYNVSLPALPERGDYDARTLRKCSNYWA